MGFEPTTPSLPRKYSTPELRRLNCLQLRLKLDGLPSFKLLRQCATIVKKSLTKARSCKKNERETRLEPATYSLEGCRSTN
jgi:hypothetical protein